MASVLSELIQLSEQDIRQAVDDLHAIVDTPDDNTLPVRIHHPSFRDFLVNPTRCEDLDFLVNDEKAHEKMAKGCIRVLSAGLKQDMCNWNEPSMFVNDVNPSEIEHHISPDVRYACLYWIDHVHKSAAKIQDGDEVHQFLQRHLLHWLEALGWVHKVSEGINAIISLQSLVDVRVPDQRYKI